MRLIYCDMDNEDYMTLNFNEKKDYLKIENTCDVDIYLNKQGIENLITKLEEMKKHLNDKE